MAPSTTRPIRKRPSSSASTSGRVPSALRSATSPARVRAREEIRSRGSVEERIDALASSVRSLLRTSKLPGDLLENAVVALPAVVSPTDGRVSSADLPGLGASDLRERLERALRVPVTLENDVNLAAVAEQRRGIAHDVADFAFLLVGAGLGRGRVLDGKLHRGHNGNAGELDAVRSGRSDDVDPCGASVSQFAADLAAEKETKLEPPFDVQELFAAAGAGDAVGAGGRRGGSPPHRASRPAARGHARSSARRARRQRRSQPRAARTGPPLAGRVVALPGSTR